MNIDYNAVIEILKSFLNNEKIEILGISVGEERQVKDAIRNLLTAYEKEKNKDMSCDLTETRADHIDESTMLKQIKLKLQEKNIPIETLLAEFERLEDLEDDREMLKAELEKEKEKNKELNKYIEDRAKIGKNIQTFINKDYVEQEYISKDKIKELREIDNIDLIQFKIRELLEERN